jgi:hypothetical protein
VQKTCGVCFDGAYATKKLVLRLYIPLLLSHWEYSTPPAATSSNSQWVYRYLVAAAGGFYEQKLLKYRTLVAVSAIWAQLLRRQVAYGYMGCSAMCHLGTIFLVA